MCSDKYINRFSALPKDEQGKVLRIIEAVGKGTTANDSDYELSDDSRKLVIDIIREKVLKV
jgi:hypothetical protein